MYETEDKIKTTAAERQCYAPSAAVRDSRSMADGRMEVVPRGALSSSLTLQIQQILNRIGRHAPG